MRAIILAAGKGSRISDAIGFIPKSTLVIDGKPIIRNTVEKLLSNNMKVAICTGYRPAKIQEALANLDVLYYNNPFYDITNNIASLWFAREFFTNDEDCLILSADVIFDEKALNSILDARGSLLMATDSTRINDGDYFLKLDDHERIIEYGPDIPLPERSCEYVGISKVSRDAIPAFKNKMEEMINDGAYQNYFEKIFFSFIGSNDYPLKTIDIAGSSWREIDRVEDYRKALLQFS